MQSEFPAPSPDKAGSAEGLAALSFPRHNAPLTSLQTRATVASAILDELDILFKEATGKPCITRLLERFGTTRVKAISAFVSRQEKADESALDAICEIMDLPQDAVLHYYPDAGKIQSQNEVSEGIKHLLTADDRSVSPRELAIEAVTRTLIPDLESYDRKKLEVTEAYEQLFESMCNPKTGDVIALSAQKAWKPAANALQKVGTFIYRSVVAQTLPGFIKTRLKLDKDHGNGSDFEHAAFMASMLISSIPLTYLSMPLLGHPPASNPAMRVIGVCLAYELAIMAELLGRAIFAAAEKRIYPGSTLLEVACLPLRLGMKIYGALSERLGPVRQQIREQKSSRLREEGF